MNYKRTKKGFTLIELLIVIGLLGALTALVLPSLSADREEALGDVCDYNQAGSVRTLRQYKQLTGVYPSDMHTGLQGIAAGSLAMEGLPGAQNEHMVDADGDGTADAACPSLHALTADQAASLKDAGITSVCSNSGLNSDPVADGVVIVRANNGSAAWLDDSDPAQEMTFDGVSITNWENGSGDSAKNSDGTDKPGVVAVFWVAPTTNWAKPANANKDWGKGNVDLGIEMEGQCPIPAEAASGDEVSFSYYMAYFKVYDDGTAAKLIGTTCPECGVMNP